jgi:prephenate dehydrogenase/cyclohexadieny/prephenate dehydrogenase
MSHPISGSEASGPRYGSKNLFKNKWCILIKSKQNKLLENKLSRFWKKLGSRILFMQEQEHDKIFAVTSHLPHLVAYNLIKTAQDFQKTHKKNIIKYSAGGLRDYSRLAASNEIMWRDVFFNNSKNMSKIIDLFIRNLKNFKMDINKKRNSLLLDKLKKSKKIRQQILLLKHDINKPDFGREN